MYQTFRITDRQLLPLLTQILKPAEEPLPVVIVEGMSPRQPTLDPNKGIQTPYIERWLWEVVQSP
ncbi:hypothetical protein Z951_02895 [Streptomyces sp. PRh5]|nr:hypothetical protein Z951_02895 [Streptomyces sp. PRh5]